MHDSDQFKGFSTLTVPVGLTDDRSTGGLLKLVDLIQCRYRVQCKLRRGEAIRGPATCWAAQQGLASNQGKATIDPVAANLLNAKLPNGKFLIPSVQNTDPSQLFGGSNVFLSGSSLFTTNMAVGDLDYDINQNDRISAKYFFQHAPNASPFTISKTGGFPEVEDSGAHVASLSNSITLGPRMNWRQLFGYSRQKVYTAFEPQIPGNLGIGLPSGTFPACHSATSRTTAAVPSPLVLIAPLSTTAISRIVGTRPPHSSTRLEAQPQLWCHL